MNILDHWRVFTKRWLLVVIPFCLVVVSAGLFAKFEKREYSATTQILPLGDTSVNRIALIVGSRLFFQKVLQGVARKENIIIPDGEITAVNVTRVRADGIQISINGYSPVYVTLVANQIFEELKKILNARARVSIVAKRRYLKQRLVELKKESRVVSEKLQSFRKSHLVTTVEKNPYKAWYELYSALSQVDMEIKGVASSLVQIPVDALTPPPLMLIDKAVMPDTPSYPNVRFILAGAVVLGVMFGLSLASGVEYIQHLKELEKT